MTKTKSTKRALLTSGLALLLCLSMFVGTTFAWFTDSVVSGNNKIVAGNLDIELEYYDGSEWKTVSGATNLFSESLWEPGHAEVVYLRLSNLGTLALKYELAINIVSETPSINVYDEVLYISDYINMGIVKGLNGETSAYANRAAAVAAVSGAGIISDGYVADGSMTAGQAAEYMAVVVYMPESVGNEANYKTGSDKPTINMGINLVATQLEYEEDSFGDDYDEAAKYVISSNEEMIFNGNEFDTLVTNNGTVDMTNAKIENDNTGFENYGAATLNNVIVNAGTPGTQAYGYAINAYAGSTTVLNDVTVNSANGAIGVVDGANLTFNSGSVEVDSKSTSGRYLFYVVGAGSTLTINDGNFDFNKTQNQKRAYIYADAGTTVYVNGGTFGKASTRSGYTAGILGSGTVIITGGTFGFDPTTWVAPGFQAVKNGSTWTVQPKATDNDSLKNSIVSGETVALSTGNYTLPTLSGKVGVTIIGAADGSTVIGGTTSTGFGGNFGKDTTIKNVTFSGSTNGVRYSYAQGGTTTFDNCTFAGDSTYGFHIDQSNGATFIFNNCTFVGFNAFASDLEKVVFNNCTFKSNGNYGHTNIWSVGEFNNCTWEENTSYGPRGNSARLFFDGVELIYDAADLATALTEDVENISVKLMDNIDCPISTLGTITGGSGEYKLGGVNTASITIDLNNYKLNLTTTYWSAIGAKNDNATFTIKNGSMTSSQATGTWNSYDVTFANCNYVITDVKFDKAVAFTNAGKSVSLTNVTITETHDYYALWITAEGQNVTINDLTVDSLGRGIKIDEQYVSTPAKVTLNITDSKFTTAKKAAILVKSIAGAEITVDNVDISAVAVDTTNAVWVDADSAAYAAEVTVNGASVILEP